MKPVVLQTLTSTSSRVANCKRRSELCRMHSRTCKLQQHFKVIFWQILASFWLIFNYCSYKLNDINLISVKSLKGRVLLGVTGWMDGSIGKLVRRWPDRWRGHFLDNDFSFMTNRPICIRQCLPTYPPMVLLSPHYGQGYTNINHSEKR